MYIRDLKNTKGHISGLTCGEWHPKDKATILTSSEDGSLRIWDVNEFKTQKQVSLLFTFLVLDICDAFHSYNVKRGQVASSSPLFSIG